MHVINLTLNLVHGGRLAWQERKAAPFVVTPMHAGAYYLGYRNRATMAARMVFHRYCGRNVRSRGESQHGLLLIPADGAAADIFNVRLGWWLGNPGLAGVEYLLQGGAEAVFAAAVIGSLGNDRRSEPYIYLSDGGHFENMGLFEMVLRRCRLIVATDAGADPDYQFEDIGNAVRKIRIDLGIPIEFDSMPIHRRTAASRRRAVVTARSGVFAIPRSTVRMLLTAS